MQKWNEQTNYKSFIIILYRARKEIRAIGDDENKTYFIMLNIIYVVIFRRMIANLFALFF